MNDFLQLVGMLILFAMVLSGAYFTTKWLSRLQYHQNKGKNMQIIETLRISPNKVIQLIKIGERYMAVGVSKDHMQLIGEISKDEVKDIMENQENAVGASFKEQFHQLLNRGNKD